MESSLSYGQDMEKRTREIHKKKAPKATQRAKWGQRDEDAQPIQSVIWLNTTIVVFSFLFLRDGEITLVCLQLLVWNFVPCSFFVHPQLPAVLHTGIHLMSSVDFVCVLLSFCHHGLVL
uniref:Uncharacterized protein n=1 Tax=Populus trichocarpa TaxID=3694 RepID=A9PBD8_POPTR|nr:unknown [Populus trichocarpa]